MTVPSSLVVNRGLLLWAVAATGWLVVTYAAGCVVARKALEQWPDEGH